MLSIAFAAMFNVSAIDYRSYTGEVTEYKRSATRMYKVNGLTVARGGEKFVKPYVGQIIKLTCYIKANKIVRIKNSEVVGKAKSKLQGMSVLELRRAYKTSSSETISKYRGKEISYTASATAIGSKGSLGYMITLDNGLGRIYISQVDLPRDLHGKLFALKESKSGGRRITFKGKWSGNQGDILLFREISSIR